MAHKIEIEVSEVIELFFLIEKINHLFHQPMYYEDPQMIERFADENYELIKKMYYETVWSWLPIEVRDEIENR